MPHHSAECGATLAPTREINSEISLPGCQPIFFD
jgi:hypothetical protein